MRHANADAASEARDVSKGGPPRRRPIGSTYAAVSPSARPWPIGSAVVTTPRPESAYTRLPERGYSAPLSPTDGRVAVRAWCGVVRDDVVWCGVVRGDVVWCGEG